MTTQQHQPRIHKVATTQPHAAQRYTCTLCDEPIERGEIHNRLVYSEDGVLNFARFHILCSCREDQ
jgi:hypothetical protein